MKIFKNPWPHEVHRFADILRWKLRLGPQEMPETAGCADDAGGVAGGGAGGNRLSAGRRLAGDMAGARVVSAARRRRLAVGGSGVFRNSARRCRCRACAGRSRRLARSEICRRSMRCCSRMVITIISTCRHCGNRKGNADHHRGRPRGLAAGQGVHERQRTGVACGRGDFSRHPGDGDSGPAFHREDPARPEPRPLVRLAGRRRGLQALARGRQRLLPGVFRNRRALRADRFRHDSRSVPICRGASCGRCT